jgi:hypothetical protein
VGVVAQSDLRVTITDGKGKELLSFRMGSEERYIISTKNSSLTHRKLSREDRYWSKETIMEVVREMASKN